MSHTSAHSSQQPCREAIVLAVQQHPSQPTPLALAKVAGLSLAQHCLYRLQAAGINRCTVVLGNHASQVRRHFEHIARSTTYGCHMQFVNVSDWQKGDGYSILQAKKTIKSPCFLITSIQYLLPVELIQKMVTHHSSAPVCIAVDSDAASPDETDLLKLQLQDHQAVALGCKLPQWNGRYAGLMYATPALLCTMETCCQQHQYSLAEALTAQQSPIPTVDAAKLPWQRICNYADIKKAQRHLLAQLNKNKQDGFFSQYIGRFVSSTLSVRLASTGLTPNQITCMGFVVILLAALLLATHSYPLQALGALVVVLACILDGCDGEVARLRCQQTPYGAWLDTVLDRYADSLLTLAITWASFQHTPQAWIWLAGSSSALGFLLTSYTKKEYQLRHAHPYPHTTMARLGQRDIRIACMVTGALLGFPFAAVIAAGVLSHVVVLWILLTGNFSAQAT
ncbi:MAG: CDP-alcohol phosphatidyltransferase family protein [Myxococcota bacterium]